MGFDTQRALCDGDAPPPFLKRPLPAAQGSAIPGIDSRTPGEDRDEACGGKLLPVSMTPGGESTNLLGRLADVMALCPPVRHEGSAGSTSSAPFFGTWRPGPRACCGGCG